MRAKEREGGKCFVVLLLDWAVVGHKVEQQSSKCRWQLTGLAFCVVACLYLCFFTHAAMQPLKTCQAEHWGKSKKKQNAAMCQTSQNSPLPCLSPSGRWDMIAISTAELNLTHPTTTTNNNNNDNNYSNSRSYSMSHQIPHWPFVQMILWGKHVTFPVTTTAQQHTTGGSLLTLYSKWGRKDFAPRIMWKCKYKHIYANWSFSTFWITVLMWTPI